MANEGCVEIYSWKRRKRYFQESYLERYIY